MYCVDTFLGKLHRVLPVTAVTNHILVNLIFLPSVTLKGTSTTQYKSSIFFFKSFLLLSLLFKLLFTTTGL